MRNRTFFGWSVGAIVLASLCTFAISQDKAGDQPGGDKPKMPAGADQAAMQQMMEATKPGPHHKALEALAGDFKYAGKFKMDPSQDWIPSTGDYHGDMIFDGRYLTFHVSGPMMGGNFEGMGVMGYDNLLQKAVSGWIDNMGTGVMRSEGSFSDDNKTITFEGKMLDPMMKKEVAFKQTFEIKSNDEFVMRWWSPGQDGKMFESMNITYTRAK